MSKRSADERIQSYRDKIKKLENKSPKRRRVMVFSDSDSSFEEITNNKSPTIIATAEDVTYSEVTVPPLNPDLLLALGDPTLEKPINGEKIHPDLAQRWLHILKKGLDKNVKEYLLKEYTIPENCKLLKAPSLNREISAAITDAARLRDQKLETSQQQLGLGISALNKGMSILLTGDDKIQAVKILSDASRILSDLHQCETLGRTKLLTPGLDKNFINIVSGNDRDDRYRLTIVDALFGNDLPEKIKASKAIEKQGSQIKKPDQRPSAISSSTRSNIRDSRQGNWRAPSRSSNKRGGRGGLKRGTAVNRRGQSHQSCNQSKWNINRFQRANQHP